MGDKMTANNGVCQLASHEADQMVSYYAEKNAAIFLLNASISTKRDFFRAISQKIQLDPPLGDGLRWDALSDSLWNGLDLLESSKVLIVWPNASLMKTDSPEEFSIATSVLSDVAASLGTKEDTCDEPKEVMIVQLIS
jgi:RNAse (barnase) inhibitor barstar